MNPASVSISDSDKAAAVRSMFAEIAPRYDLLNHALSLNIDRRWRRFTLRKVADVLAKPGACALDLCCGTGDLSLELGGIAETIGLDFCHPMLRIASRKVSNAGSRVGLVEGDALRVPLASESFDVVTMAFGLRNLESIEAGLAEISRLLKPGGRAAILEFSHQRAPLFRIMFKLYFERLLPRIGNAVSGSKFAYRYLPESVREFPDQNTLAAMMESAGLVSVRYFNLFGGVAALHLGEKK
jgi:demethylmenaquinone methyltransferase/2-methoxy-6-polyprenyl-1,4-benzoquinol methylase